MADATKPIASPADVLELLIDGMDRDIRARYPGAYGPPEDAMPQDEYRFRRLLLTLSELPEDDHEARARKWDELAEAAEQAASAEWALHHGEGEG